MSDIDIAAAIAIHIGWRETFRNFFEGIHGEALKALASVDAATCPLGPCFTALGKLGTASPTAAKAVILHQEFHATTHRIVTLLEQSRPDLAMNLLEGELTGLTDQLVTTLELLQQELTTTEKVGAGKTAAISPIR